MHAAKVALEKEYKDLPKEALATTFLEIAKMAVPIVAGAAGTAPPFVFQKKTLEFIEEKMAALVCTMGGSVVYTKTSPAGKPKTPAAPKSKGKKRLKDPPNTDAPPEDETPTKKARSNVRTSQAVLIGEPEKMNPNVHGTTREKRFLDDAFSAICSAGQGFGHASQCWNDKTVHAATSFALQFAFTTTVEIAGRNYSKWSLTRQAIKTYVKTNKSQEVAAMDDAQLESALINAVMAEAANNGTRTIHQLRLDSTTPEEVQAMLLWRSENMVDKPTAMLPGVAAMQACIWEKAKVAVSSKASPPDQCHYHDPSRCDL